MYQERGNHEEKKLEKDRGCHVERCVSCIGSCSSGRYGAGISWSGVLAGEPAHSQSVLLSKESLQPYGTCLQIGELKNWSPDNDPDARYNRSSIPLRQRYMGPSVNPLASRDAKVMPLAMSNARASEAESQGGEGDFVYAFNNFQYIDTYNFWGGSSAEGPICIPSPEHIDSAHRNGVQATGTIFIPWGDEEYGGRFVRELVAQDEQGNYPCADKLIEVAQYYGFDGYIFNAESGTGVSGFKEFLAYMQEKAPEIFESAGTTEAERWEQILLMPGCRIKTSVLRMSGGWICPETET